MEEKLGREKSSREMKCVKRVGPCIHVTRPDNVGSARHDRSTISIFLFWTTAHDTMLTRLNT